MAQWDEVRITNEKNGMVEVIWKVAGLISINVCRHAYPNDTNRSYPAQKEAETTTKP
jgi:hypothetical protein